MPSLAMAAIARRRSSSVIRALPKSYGPSSPPPRLNPHADSSRLTRGQRQATRAAGMDFDTMGPRVMMFRTVRSTEAP
jgi:hypothetical protein